MSINLYDLIHQTARRQPDHAAIVGPGVDDRITYRELNDAIDQAAHRLQHAGVLSAHCVGLHVPSGRDYIILNYAVWKCGGRVVPIPVELTDSEKQEIGREIALDFIVSPAGNLDFAAPFRTDSAAEEIAAQEIAGGAVIVPVRSPRRHPAGFLDVDAAFLRFTSGTTGTSKGVVLSHQTIFDRIHAANEALQLGPDDRVVWLLSMSYHFAVSIVAYLSFGATIVLPGNALGNTIIDAILRHGGTLMYGSPLHYALMADCTKVSSLPTLRVAISTAMSLDPRIASAFQRRFNIPVSQALGLIEVGLPCINLNFAAKHNDSVGPVLPSYRLRLDDVGLGPNLGEILFSGKGFLDAYYEPWRTRAEIMPDGWFRTGDIGELDADGCLTIRGRSKDVINVMGMKVFPIEVEAALKSHPAVREACVFSHPHPRQGEAPHARVVLNDAAAVSEQELIDHCQSRLAPYKVPLEIEFVDVLERTASGKILRRDTGRTKITVPE